MAAVHPRLPSLGRRSSRLYRAGYPRQYLLFVFAWLIKPTNVYEPTKVTAAQLVEAGHSVRRDLLQLLQICGLSTLPKLVVGHSYSNDISVASIDSRNGDR